LSTSNFVFCTSNFVLRTSKFHQPACSQQAGAIPPEAGKRARKSTRLHFAAAGQANQRIHPLKTQVQKQIQKQNCLVQVQKLVIAN